MGLQGLRDYLYDTEADLSDAVNQLRWVADLPEVDGEQYRIISCALDSVRDAVASIQSLAQHEK